MIHIKTYYIPDSVPFNHVYRFLEDEDFDNMKRKYLYNDLSNGKYILNGKFLKKSLMPEVIELCKTMGSPFAVSLQVIINGWDIIEMNGGFLFESRSGNAASRIVKNYGVIACKDESGKYYNKSHSWQICILNNQGRYHSENGPAVKNYDGDICIEEFYCLNGKKMSEKEWEDQVATKLYW